MCQGQCLSFVSSLKERVLVGDLRERHHLEDRRRREHDVRLDLKSVARAWTGLIWLSVGTSVELL